MYSDIGFKEIKEITYTFDGMLFREMQMVKELTDDSEIGNVIGNIVKL